MNFTSEAPTPDTPTHQEQMMTDTATQPDLEARLEGIATVRTLFQEAFQEPLRKALRRYPGIQAAAAVYQIPLEGAAAGFDVRIAMHRNGWHIRLSRRIDADTEFYASAKARDLVAALVQLNERGHETLAYLDSDTRSAIAQAQPTAAIGVAA